MELLDNSLPVLIRVAGIVWIVVASGLFLWLGRRAALERELVRMTAEAETSDADTRRRPSPWSRYKEHSDPVENWIERDDRNRRRLLLAHGALLLLSGLSMVFLHVSAPWCMAALVAAQGVYFLQRGHAARRAPTRKAAEHARPSRPSLRVGWVSLAVGEMVWFADARGVLP
jgi:hypothetical protein